jgi:predicted enzyme related to lactoylglutathione lyase
VRVERRSTLAAAALLWALLAQAVSAAETPAVAVGAQYDTAHVYVAPEVLPTFIASFVATFGGTSTTPSVTTVTPTASSTLLEAALTPEGLISGFGFKTPIPYPFGSERTGYLVTDLDIALRAARACGASIVVAPFKDPIGRDAIIQWPGGVMMQLYWHTRFAKAAALATVPENRVYVSADSADAFVRDFVRFAHGTVVSDDAKAPGIEIGRPTISYRRIRISSLFGKLVVLVSDGQLPYPYGREIMGYAVANLNATLAKATASGATVLVAPYAADGRQKAFVQFPGGYIAEIHSALKK